MTAGDTNSPVFDFCSLDYSSVVNDLTVYAQKIYPDDLWTDFNESNFATFLLEQMGYATDLLAYNMNASVLETIASTLIREQNFRNIAKSFDYAMLGATASSSSSMRIYNLSSSSGDYPLTVSEHLQFTTDSGVIFQPVATQIWTWPPSSDDPTYGYYVDLAVVQGQEIQDVLGTSDGRAGQRFALSTANVLDGTLSVTVGPVGSPVVYSLITSLIDAGPNDKDYLVDTDDSQISYISFGDNINGIIPPLGQTIIATYKVGGGSSTNFPIGTSLDVTGGPFVSIPAAITNGTASVVLMAAATSGGPRQTLTNAKRAFSSAIKANERAVTDDDYAAYASEVSGVFKASAVPGTPVGGATPVLLFIVPSGATGTPSSVLSNLILHELRDVKMSGKRVIVRDPSYVQLVLQVDTYVQPRASKLAVQQRLRDALLAIFDPDNVTFGSSFDLQTLYALTSPSNIEGLLHLFYRKFTVTPAGARYVNKPTTGNGSVSWISVDWDIVQRREWSIKVTTPDPINGVYCSRFIVRQRNAGFISGVTSTDATDSAGAYTTDELVGQYFHPRPEELGDAYRWLITGNTATDITVSGVNLLMYVQPDDPYVAEVDEAAYGKILSTTASPVTGSRTITVASSQSFLATDTVRITDSSGADYVVAITTVLSPTSLYLASAVTLAAGAVVSSVWTSSDSSVQFVVTDGTTAFVSGDEFYVDTYPATGDVRLRSENFPLLSTDNIDINIIGGV
jgi:hypothetical protein